MINHITKFILIFIFIILFLSFKNQTKILENNLVYLKKNFNNDYQNFIKKEILLTKQINQFQINDFDDYIHIDNKKIIKFNRSEFNDFTIIKVNYVQSE